MDDVYLSFKIICSSDSSNGVVFVYLCFFCLIVFCWLWLWVVVFCWLWLWLVFVGICVLGG